MTGCVRYAFPTLAGFIRLRQVRPTPTYTPLVVGSSPTRPTVLLGILRWQPLAPARLVRTPRNLRKNPNPHVLAELHSGFGIALPGTALRNSMA